tara:strand:+ start:733 stop:987 length:255 start_codon:yes stop_codon:yes gene_type:complete
LVIQNNLPGKLHLIATFSCKVLISKAFLLYLSWSFVFFFFGLSGVKGKARLPLFSEKRGNVSWATLASDRSSGSGARILLKNLH